MRSQRRDTRNSLCLAVLAAAETLPYLGITSAGSGERGWRTQRRRTTLRRKTAARLQLAVCNAPPLVFPRAGGTPHRGGTTRDARARHNSRLSSSAASAALPPQCVSRHAAAVAASCALEPAARAASAPTSDRSRAHCAACEPACGVKPAQAEEASERKSICMHACAPALCASLALFVPTPLPSNPPAPRAPAPARPPARPRRTRRAPRAQPRALHLRQALPRPRARLLLPRTARGARRSARAGRRARRRVSLWRRPRRGRVRRRAPRSAAPLPPQPAQLQAQVRQRTRMACA